MNPSPTDLAELAALRLSSGIEMQQRWQSHSASASVGTHPASPGASSPGSMDKLSSDLPRVVDFTPLRGNHATMVTAVLQTMPLQIAKLAFNNLVVDTKQMQSAHGLTTLVAQVPHLQQTNSRGPIVPVSLCLLDNDSVTKSWTIAEFTYLTEGTKPDTPDYRRGYPFSPKGKPKPAYSHGMMSADTASATGYQSFYQHQQHQDPHARHDPPQQSQQSQQLQQQPQSQPQNQHQHQHQQRHGRLSSSASPVTGTSYATTPTQQLPQYSYPYDNRFTYRASSRQPHSNTLAYSPSLGLISPTHPDSFSGVLSADFDSPEAQTVPTTPTAAYHAHSHAMSSHSGGSFGRPSISLPGYQPYQAMTSRANLDIAGSLNDMMQGWSTGEWEHRRRLVQFWREQGDHNQIRCTFRSVSPDELFQPNSGQIVVSCIYWLERADCFITSVDCIHLLESLMNIRFTVEEKNRVRRNLEGFRPLTVSKCKSETAGFFKLIMGFPNPKPRNIEKDVKVFPWKTLPYALKKIVTKYTTAHSNNNNPPPPTEPPPSTPASPVVTTPFFQRQQPTYANPQPSRTSFDSSIHATSTPAPTGPSPGGARPPSETAIEKRASAADENEYHRQMTKQVMANLKTED